MSVIDERLNDALASLKHRSHFNDCGAGRHNAEVLTRLRLRPAVIDTSSIIYRQMFAKAKEYCKLGDDTVVTHAVAIDSLRDMAEACMQFNAAPILCFDSKHNYRKDFYVDYKQGRRQSLKSAEEERVTGLFRQVSVVLRAVYAQAYSIQTFCLYGYESDDLVAALVLGLRQENDFAGDVVIVSNDHDLHQLVITGVYFADVQSGVLLTARDIAKHYIEPSLVVAAKTIGGCKSDNIKGLAQFGDKSVGQVIAGDFNSVTLTRARKTLEDVDGCLEIMERNRKLVELPLSLNADMPPLWLNDKMWSKKGIPDEVVDVLTAYGIPEKMYAYFGEVDRGRRMSPVPTCGYVKRDRKRDRKEVHNGEAD